MTEVTSRLDRIRQRLDAGRIGYTTMSPTVQADLRDLLAVVEAARLYRATDVAHGHFPTRDALDAALAALDKEEA